MPQESSHGNSIEWFKECTSEIYTLPLFLDRAEWSDFLQYLLSSRRPDCLLNAGSRFLYELFPSISQTHSDLAIVDLLFNTIGHTELHISYKEFITFALAENNDVVQWYKDKAGWDMDNIRKISSGVDLNTYQPRPRPVSLAQELEISPDDIVVGFSGRLSTEKAPEVFVEIARLSHHSSKLRFIMTGAGPMTDKITKLVHTLPESVRFNFVGLADDVTPYLNLYDILVLPSFMDGRPLVVMEALSCGVPVLASRVGGLPEMIEDGLNGYLCTPGSAQEFSNILQTLAESPQLIDKLKLGARLFATTNLNAEKAFHEYDLALREAIDIHRKQLML